MPEFRSWVSYSTTDGQVTAILHDEEGEHAIDAASARAAIENVKNNRALFATEAAYRKELAVYEYALRVMEGAS